MPQNQECRVKDCRAGERKEPLALAPGEGEGLSSLLSPTSSMGGSRNSPCAGQRGSSPWLPGEGAPLQASRSSSLMSQDWLVETCSLNIK